MRKLGIAGLLLAAACASPPATRSSFQISPAPSEPGAFSVSDVAGEPETRRYRIQPEKYWPEPMPREGVLEEVTRRIRTFVAPGTWEADPRRALYVEKDELVVRHTPEAHAQVSRLLETLKNYRTLSLRVTISYINFPGNDASVFKSLSGLKEGLGGVVDRKSIRELRTQAARFGVTVQSGPSMTFVHGGIGLVGVNGRFPYIKSVESGEEGYAPVIDLVITGLEVKLRGVMNGPQSESILLDAAAQTQDLGFFSLFRLGDYPLQIPGTVTSRSAGVWVLNPDQAALMLVRQPRLLGGGHGVGGQPPESPMTMLVLEAERVQ